MMVFELIQKDEKTLSRAMGNILIDKFVTISHSKVAFPQETERS